MAIEYKPTKPKKEKSAKAPKAPKAPKAEKPVKIGAVQKVKTTKPKKEKPVKATKAPKPEKAKEISTFKGGKLKNAKELKESKDLKKKISPAFIITAVSILAVLIIAAVVVFTMVIPAIKRNGEQIEYIMISSSPEKTVYLIGEEANYDGLKVKVVRKNGDSFTVRYKQCEITGFNSNKAGACKINVKYENLTTHFSVKIEEPPRLTPALESVTLETWPNKTEYKLGEWLDTTGGVILCKYVDGSVYRITLQNSHISGFSVADKLGEQTITVKYIEKGVPYKLYYTINVSE